MSPVEDQCLLFESFILNFDAGKFEFSVPAKKQVTKKFLMTKFDCLVDLISKFPYLQLFRNEMMKVHIF